MKKLEKSAYIQKYHTFDGLPYISNREVTPGFRPELMFVSGIHGDELDIVTALFLALSEKQNELPPFIYFPILSQLASRAGTRRSPDGEDLNRLFDRSPLPREASRAQALMRLFGPVRQLFSLHQDNDLSNHAYFYAEGKPIDLRYLNAWRKKLFLNNYRGLSGLDDPNDPALALLAHEGYIYHPNSIQTPQMFESWAVNSGLAEQAITYEVPTKSNRKEKRDFVEAMFLLRDAA